MSSNLPLRMTHDHASALSSAIDDGLERIRIGLGELGYDANTIDFEIGLQLARRATKFLDHQEAAHLQPVNGSGNGVNKR